MDVCKAFERKDSSLLNFLEGVLSHYNKVKILVLESTDPIDWILTSMRPAISSIQHLFVLPESSQINDRSTGQYLSSKLKSTHFPGSEYADIKLHNGNDFEMIKKHLKYFDEHISCLSIRWGWGRNMAHLRVNDDCLERISASIHIGCNSEISIDFFTLRGYITEFSLSNYSVKEDLIETFARAGTLPVLQTLGFIKCRGLVGKFALLLKCRFPKLSVFNLFETDIDTSDLQALFRALNTEDDVLPQLSSLILTATNNFEPVLYFNEDTCRFQELYIESVRETTFHERLPWSTMQNLKRLGLSYVSKTEVLRSIKQLRFLQSLILSACTFYQSDLNVLADIVIDCNLRHLDISDNTGISGKLSILLDHTYPSLDTLVLSNCKLTEQDLESLPLASVGGRLPKLKHIDISDNKICRGESFFSHDCKWDHLISINISQCETLDSVLSFKSDFLMKLSCGLRSLQELTFSGNIIHSFTEKCEQLHTVRIKAFDVRCMAVIVSALETGALPALRNVCVSQRLSLGYGSVRVPYESARILTQFGVFCHETVPSTNSFTRSCCLCRHTQV